MPAKTPAKKNDAAERAARSMIITRVLSAPPEKAFEAWTKPEALARWFGPNGFSITMHIHDFRVGGVWRFVMHGPDGKDYQNRIGEGGLGSIGLLGGGTEGVRQHPRVHERGLGRLAGCAGRGACQSRDGPADGHPASDGGGCGQSHRVL